MTNESETNGSNRMNKLKEILLKEASALIPFGFLFGRINQYWCDEEYLHGKPVDQEFFTPRLFRRLVTNSFITVATPLYVASALYFGANPLNPRDYLQKRSVCVEQREEQERRQEEQERKDYLKKQFHEADGNNNDVLDFDEFCDYESDRGGNN